MDPEHFDLREACRRVNRKHLESVTPEDIEKVRNLMTSDDMSAVMFTLAERYKFGDVIAFCQPRSLTKALQLAASNLSKDAERLHESHTIVRRNKLLQCSIFENVDEELHHECVGTLLEHGEKIGDPTALRDGGKVKSLPADPRKKMEEVWMEQQKRKAEMDAAAAASAGQLVLQATAPEPKGRGNRKVQ